jgi:hypothetical protein
LITGPQMGSRHQDCLKEISRRKKNWSGRLNVGRKLTSTVLKFNFRHCTENYRRVLSSDRASYMKIKKVIVTQINVVSGHLLQEGQDTKTIWRTYSRSYCDFYFDFSTSTRHSTANCRPVISLEREPYMKNKQSNCHSNNCNIYHLLQKGEDTKTNCPTDRRS